MTTKKQMCVACRRAVEHDPHCECKCHAEIEALGKEKQE